MYSNGSTVNSKTEKCIFDKQIIVISFVALFVFHGEILFNKLCWHDDAGAVFSGWFEGLLHGRWFQWIITKILQRITGLEIVSVVTGCVVATSIGLMACLLFSLFNIRKLYMKLSLIMIFCSIPAVTGHFGYMGSAGLDFIGKCVCVLAAYIFCENYLQNKGWKAYLVSACLFACALGEYQCYFAFYISILLLNFTKKIIAQNVGWKYFWREAFQYLSVVISGLLIYLGVLQIFLFITGEKLTSYAGTDTYGIVNIKGYLVRVILAYKDFWIPNINSSYCMFPFHWGGWHTMLMIALILLVIILVVLMVKVKRYCSMVQYLITFILLPLSLNFNFVLYGSSATHSLHMYHFVLLFIYYYIILQEIMSIIQDIEEQGGRLYLKTNVVSNIVVLAVMICGLLYVRYDNFCYTQIEIRQERAISYFTTLITRIQSIEGYSNEYPIAFINEFEKENVADEIHSDYDYPITNPFGSPIVNSVKWKSFMGVWCGYNPEVIDESIYENNQIVIEMPNYPNNGSIQIIDNVIVVKF